MFRDNQLNPDPLVSFCVDASPVIFGRQPSKLHLDNLTATSAEWQCRDQEKGFSRITMSESTFYRTFVVLFK